MTEAADLHLDHARRLGFIREETRFEIVLLHDRINALIAAEAFLTIAFVIAMTNTNPQWGWAFARIVGPLLSLVGLILAALSWPGVDASFKIIVEWNVRQMQLIGENPHLTDAMWRAAVLGRHNVRADPDQRKTMLFARVVPAVFGVAYAILTIVALLLPHR